jgi:hypothetical protein
VPLHQDPLETAGKGVLTKGVVGRQKLDGKMKEDGMQWTKGPGTGSFFFMGKSKT